ncbi:MAG: T9SS type A sorting domain-containing protein [Candidatus Latescibacterota bacterium]
MKPLKRNLSVPLCRSAILISALAALLFLAIPAAAHSDRSVAGGRAAGRGVEACGTWVELSRGTAASVLSMSLARPGDGPLMRDSSHFRVHYQNGSLDSYADSILAAAEKAYSVLVDTLGYLQPPSDAPNGGDGRIDIYVQPSAAFPYLGVTYPETYKGVPYPNSYTSYMELTDSLGVDLLLTTTVHEFFHTIQIGYDRDENISFLELISVWAEDRVYDDINAYRRHLPDFFSRPHRALFGHTYSNVVWAIYLAENFGDGVIKDILATGAAVAGNDIRQATENVLGGFSTDLITQVITFNAWNFFTGARDDGLHYEEGAGYPLILIEETVDCLPRFGYTNSLHQPGTLGCNFYRLCGDFSSDSLGLALLPEYWAASTVQLIRFGSGGISTDRYDYAQFTVDPPPITDGLWSETDTLLLTYTIDSSALSTNEFGFSAYHAPAEPPAEPYVLVLDRDGCRRPFDGTNDDFSPRLGEDFPFADALAENSLRFVLSDSLPGVLTYCDAIFIVGGYDGMGPLFSSAELETLMAYMDHGGDVYLESNRLGDWLDPSVGQPSPAEEAFWSYFGCDFIPGEPMSTGNVASWSTGTNSPVGAFAYSYDAASPADDYVGELLPSVADTLAVDQSNRVRATVYSTSNESHRIHSTVLLGASTAVNAQSARSKFLYRILELFDSSVPALAVTFMNVTVRQGQVVFEGVVEGYGGEPLSLVRYDGTNASREVPVALSIQSFGAELEIHAVDSPPPGGRYLYHLRARRGDSDRLIWRQEVNVEATPLSLRALYPNPTAGAITLIVDASQEDSALLCVYDAAGRLVYRDTQALRVGGNEITFAGRDHSGRRLSSGVYFLRFETTGHSFHKKLVIVR